MVKATKALLTALAVFVICIHADIAIQAPAANASGLYSDFIQTEDGEELSVQIYLSGQFSILYPTSYLTEKRFMHTKDTGSYRVPYVVLDVLSSLETSWEKMITEMGYLEPVGSRSGPLSVVLLSLEDSKVLGFAATEDDGTPYIFVDPFLKEDYLKATVAHEFFHMVQFGYEPQFKLEFSSKLAEGTATWMEDEVYDELNIYKDVLDHSPLHLPEKSVFGALENIDAPNSISRYGTFLWYSFLSERFDTDIIRKIWESYFRISRESSQIEVVPYYRAFQATKATLQRNYSTSLEEAFAEFTMWNLKPSQYAEGSDFPSSAMVAEIKEEDFPFNSADILIRDTPEVFGTNYIELQTKNMKGYLNIDFEAHQNAAYYLALVPYANEEALLDKKVDLTTRIGEHSSLFIPLRQYEKVVLVIGVVENRVEITDASKEDIFTGKTYPYEFTASLLQIEPKAVSNEESPTETTEQFDEYFTSSNRVNREYTYSTLITDIISSTSAEGNIAISNTGRCDYSSDCLVQLYSVGEKKILETAVGTVDGMRYLFKKDDTELETPLLVGGSKAYMEEEYNSASIGQYFDFIPPELQQKVQKALVTFEYKEVDNYSIPALLKAPEKRSEEEPEEFEKNDTEIQEEESENTDVGSQEEGSANEDAEEVEELSSASPKTKALLELSRTTVELSTGMVLEQICSSYTIKKKGMVQGTCDVYINRLWSARVQLLLFNSKLKRFSQAKKAVSPAISNIPSPFEPPFEGSLNQQDLQQKPETKTPIQQSTFTDITPQTPYKKAIDYLSQKNIVSGYADRTFQPNRIMNRAEFTKVIMQAKAENTKIDRENIQLKNCFVDVEEAWFSEYICEAKHFGIVSGYADGFFKPNSEMPIAEGYKIILEAFIGGDNIPDAEGAWYQKYLQYAWAKNIAHKQSFTPWESITRGEMAQVMYALIAHLPTVANEEAETEQTTPVKNSEIPLINKQPEQPLESSTVSEEAFLQELEKTEDRLRRYIIIVKRKSNNNRRNTRSAVRSRSFINYSNAFLRMDQVDAFLSSAKDRNSLGTEKDNESENGLTNPVDELFVDRLKTLQQRLEKKIAAEGIEERELESAYWGQLRNPNLSNSFVNKQYRFSMLYPEDWNRFHLRNTVAGFESPTENQYVVVWVDRLFKNYFNYEKQAEATIKYLEEERPGFELISSNPSHSLGKEAYEIEFSQFRRSSAVGVEKKVVPKRQRIHLTFFLENKHLYVLEFISTEEHYDATIHIGKAIINSFTLTGKEEEKEE